MALVKSTKYAPEIYKSLDGILLVHKPPRISTGDHIAELRNHISDQLNQFNPRPISSRLVVQGGFDDEKRIVEVPNLADHPLVVGPRYNPWELRLSAVKPRLSFRSSGLNLYLLGSANKYYLQKISNAKLISVYIISGRFGHMTDTAFYDGKIHDKTTYKHILSGRMDAVLSRIESGQYERIFDSANVRHDSREAYELAKSWPSRPPQMAAWPLIYRLRCIHLKLPEFKIEVTISNENESFLAQLIQDIGLMLKSGAYTESIRRVKLGPFDSKYSLTDADWDLQSIINNLAIFNSKRIELQELLRNHKTAIGVKTEFRQEYEQSGK